MTSPSNSTLSSLATNRFPSGPLRALGGDPVLKCAPSNYQRKRIEARAGVLGAGSVTRFGATRSADLRFGRFRRGRRRRLRRFVYGRCGCVLFGFSCARRFFAFAGRAGGRLVGWRGVGFALYAVLLLRAGFCVRGLFAFVGGFYRCGARGRVFAEERLVGDRFGGRGERDARLAF